MMMLKAAQQKDENPPLCFTIVMCPIICTLLLVAIGLSTVVPILSWVSAMSNQIFNSVSAQEISKVPGSPCEGFGKIDWVWPCVLGIAIVGTVSIVLNCCACCATAAAAKSETSEDGKKEKFKKFLGSLTCCASLANFVMFAMIFDVWVTTPELCKDAMAVSFNDGIPLWTMVEVLSVCFIISLCMLSCFCCCACMMMFCGGMALAALGNEMTQEQMEVQGGMPTTSSFRMAMAAFANELGLGEADMKTVMSGGQIEIKIGN